MIGPRWVQDEAASDPDRLLERAEHVAVLERIAVGARSGAGGAVLFEGSAGLGKSQLLAEAGRRGRAAGLEVLAARAGELERGFAYAVVLQLLEPALAALDEDGREAVFAAAAGLARPLFELGRGNEIDRHAALHGLFWLVANLADRTPLLLSVDDLHWADEPSLAFLVYLSQRIEDLPAAVVLATRRGEPGASEGVLTALAAHEGIETLAVEPLSPAATTRMVGDRLPAADGDFARACERATGGNPFLLSELIGEVERRGIEPVAAEADGVAALASAGVVRTTLARLDRLPAHCGALARSVAVLERARLGLAAAHAGLAIEEARTAAAVLSRADLVRGRDRLEFVHPLLRSAVYAEIDPMDRAHAHARAARALADEGAQPGRVAAHIELSPAEGDGWVVERLLDAATVADRDGAPANAARLLRRALDEPPASTARGEVLLRLARAEAKAGEPAAIGHLRDAIALSSGRERAEVRLELGRHLYAAGRPREAADELEAGALDVPSPDDPLAAEIEAAWVTVARIEVSLRPRAVERLRGIVERDGAGSDTYAERSLLAQVANQLVFEGTRREEALRLAHRALEGNVLLEQEGAAGMSWVVAVAALGWADDIDAFDEHGRRGLEDAERRGSVLAFGTASYSLSYSDYMAGRLAAAVADCEQALAAQPYGWSQFAPAAHAQLAWALIARDELAEADSVLHPPGLVDAWAGSSMLALVLDARSRLALARGEGEVALAAALDAGAVFEEALMHNPSCLPWRSNAALAAASLGEHERARELAASELRLARRFGAPRAIGVALRAAGVAERGAPGVELLEQSVATLEGSPGASDHLLSLVSLGAAQRRAGRRADARLTLRRATDIAQRHGAARLERVAAEELAAAGARARQRALTGPGALTPGELRVAELAAGGMTNPQIAQSLFVTVKAVKWHLRNVFQKLEISSRKQLPEALERVR